MSSAGPPTDPASLARWLRDEKGLSEDLIRAAWARQRPGVDLIAALVETGALSAEQSSAWRSGGLLVGLDRYEKISELARGGMGVVYRARDKVIGREVALKQILVELSPELGLRFKREAESLAALSHLNVLQIYDACFVGANPFLVTELIKGRSLADELKASPTGLKPEEAIPLLKALAETLEFCNKNGFIHRDVKPANILIEDQTERLVLIDFGLIKDLNATSLSHSQQSLGTPQYMAPEQVDRNSFGDLGPAVDVWGWGATAYGILSGKAPNTGKSTAQILKNLLSGSRPPLREASPEVPEWLNELVSRCLSLQAKDRPDWQQIKKALESRGPSGEINSSRRSSVPFVLASFMIVLALFLGLISEEFRKSDEGLSTLGAGASEMGLIINQEEFSNTLELSLAAPSEPNGKEAWILRSETEAFVPGPPSKELHWISSRELRIEPLRGQTASVTMLGGHHKIHWSRVVKDKTLVEGVFDSHFYRPCRISQAGGPLSSKYHYYKDLAEALSDPAPLRAVEIPDGLSLDGMGVVINSHGSIFYGKKGKTPTIWCAGGSLAIEASNVRLLRLRFSDDSKDVLPLNKITEIFTSSPLHEKLNNSIRNSFLRISAKAEKISVDDCRFASLTRVAVILEASERGPSTPISFDNVHFDEITLVGIFVGSGRLLRLNHCNFNNLPGVCVYVDAEGQLDANSCLFKRGIFGIFDRKIADKNRSKLLIQDCTFSNFTKVAIRLSSTEVAVNGSSFSDQLHAIRASDSNLAVNNCRFLDSKRSTIAVENSSTINITSSNFVELKKSIGYPTLFTDKNSKLFCQRSSFEQLRGFTLRVDGAARASINSCEIKGLGYGIAFVESDSSAEFQDIHIRVEPNDHKSDSAFPSLFCVGMALPETPARDNTKPAHHPKIGSTTPSPSTLKIQNLKISSSPNTTSLPAARRNLVAVAPRSYAELYEIKLPESFEIRDSSAARGAIRLDGKDLP